MRKADIVGEDGTYFMRITTLMKGQEFLSNANPLALRLLI